MQQSRQLNIMHVVSVLLYNFVRYHCDQWSHPSWWRSSG